MNTSTAFNCTSDHAAANQPSYVVRYAETLPVNRHRDALRSFDVVCTTGARHIADLTAVRVESVRFMDMGQGNTKPVLGYPPRGRCP